MGVLKDLPYDKPNHALIMASIIEKEASAGDDRRLVAAVLVNRLKKACVCSQTQRCFMKRLKVQQSRPQITKTDLKTKTPWNTYVINGLPKTPICNPGQRRLWLLCIQQKVITYILSLMAMVGFGLQKHWTHTTAM